jgi:hypothetical protein
VRVARARTAADKWSAETGAGVPAAEALEDREAVVRWLKESTLRPGPQAQQPLRTHRSPEYLAWRYGFAPLRYRALPVGDGAGLVIFRLRRRGQALEAAVCEELYPDDGGLRRRALRQVVRTTGADHAVVVGAAEPAQGLLPVPGQGPTLVWRDVCDNAVPSADDWSLNLGDVELS